jgi:hypothetical protein
VKSAIVFSLMVDGSGSRGCRILGRLRPGQDGQEARCHALSKPSPQRQARFERSFTHVRLMGEGARNRESADVARDRLPQPLHRELDILRLQLATALDFSLVPLFRKALEIFRCQLLAALGSVNFSHERISFGFDP